MTMTRAGNLGSDAGVEHAVMDTTRSRCAEILRDAVAVQKSFARARSLYASELSGAFCMFDFIAPNEVRLSEILAWLLDPQGSHAQGDIFLRLFCAGQGLTWPMDHAPRAQVTCEHAAEGRRIDILVTCHDWLLGIENKFGAADQPHQVRDYLSWLQGVRGGRAMHLVYLTPEKSQPTEGSLSAGAYAAATESGLLSLAGYGELARTWLPECRKHCRSPRVTAFIAEFERYIITRIEGNLDMNETAQIAADIAAQGERINAALVIANALPAAEQILMERLATDVRSALLDYGAAGAIVDGDLCDKPHTDLAIRFDAASRYRFMIHADRPRYGKMGFGLYGRGIGTGDAARLEPFLRDTYLHVERWEDWPWWRDMSETDVRLPYPADWRASPVAWNAIIDGTMARRIAKLALLFRDELRAAFPDQNLL